MNLRNATIGALLTHRAKTTPQRTALSFGDSEYTWNQVYEKAQAYGRYFLSSGLRNGDKAIIMGANSDRWVFCFYGLALIGVTIVPVNPQFKEREFNCILEETESKYIITGENVDSMMFREITDKPVISMNYINETLGTTENLVEDTSQVATILFTSGSTGFPKGVQLTHFNLVNNAVTISQKLRWNAQDHLLLTVPLFHTFGITASLLASLVDGHAIHMMKGFESAEILTMIEKKKITILSGVPSMFLVAINHNPLENYDLSSLNSGIIAGSPLTPREYLFICEQLGMDHLLQSYGQTETSPCVTMSDYDADLAKRSLTVGHVIEDCQVRIVDDKGRVLGPNENGYIHVRGINVMKGYVGCSKEYTSKDWLNTGDMGSLNEEGELTISGRTRDIIIRGGENIAALEIETLVKELPFILEARAIAMADKIMMEEVGLCVASNKEGVEELIYEHLKANLSRHKIPRYLRVVEELPKNICGKIDDIEVRKLLGGIYE